MSSFATKTLLAHIDITVRYAIVGTVAELEVVDSTTSITSKVVYNVVWL